MPKSKLHRLIFGLMTAMMLIVAALVWWYIHPTQKAEIAAKQVAEIAQEVRKSYAHRVDYWGLNTDLIISNNILTNINYDKKLINSLGKPILIGSDEDGNTVMPGERSFNIVYSDLSTAECISLATYPFEQPEELGLLQITIVGNKNKQDFSWREENYKLPVTRHEAKKICCNGSKVLWTIE